LTVLSIGKLAAGSAAASYYLERVGCPLDYYVGRGEAHGHWIGAGAGALGLQGALSCAEQEEILRRLLAGRSPDDRELVKPVLRGDPRGRVPSEPVLHALAAAAHDRDVEIPKLLRGGSAKSGSGRPQPAGGRARTTDVLVRTWERAAAELTRSQRRPRWPAPTLPADTAQRMLRVAGLDPSTVLAEATPTGRVRDVLARALRHRESRVDVRLPGLDLTLSAPKSVSLLWALSDGTSQQNPDVSELVGTQVRQAHRVAVSEALAYLDLHCTSALRGHHRGDGTDSCVETDGLIGAAFEHRSSRCGDPQLHTHVVVANLLHGRDGKWSALNTREIYAHARTAGFVYQAVLRGELTRRLGVTWNPVRNGQAEIAGVPAGLLRHFSKRRQQIEAHLEQLGLDSAAAAQNATLGTRPAKVLEDSASSEPVRLQDRWHAEALAAGFRLEHLKGLQAQPAATGLRSQAREVSAAVGPVTHHLANTLLGPAGLTDKRSTFDRRDLLRAVCEQLPAGLPIRLIGLRALATRVLRDERVVPLLGDAPVSARRYSTRELLHLEQEALELAAAQQPPTNPGAAEGPAAAFSPVAALPDWLVQQADAQAVQMQCTAEQQAMVQRLLTSGAGVEIVVGAAGSGKTRALAVAARAWQQTGIEVRGTALAAIAARVLEDSTAIPSRSLQRLLNQLDTTSPSSHVPAGLPANGGVLVVDEAGMVGTRALHTLITLSVQRQWKLVLVGDPKQLPEIAAGGLFATLAARLPTTELLGNQRQHQAWEQRALRQLRDGDVARGVAAYSRKGRVRIDDSIDALTRRLLSDYTQHLNSHPAEQVMVIASSRGDARRLNAQLRQHLLAEGRLGEQELRIALTDARDGSARGERSYRVGEQVLVTVNDYPQGLLNGTRGTVTALNCHQQALTVRLDDGRHIELDATYLQRGHLRYGYALTAHKAQGTTVDVSLLWGTQALTRETGYVALSRGRQANYLYSTWDLLQRDGGLTDRADLHLPDDRTPKPDAITRARLTHAGLVERLERSGRQRTARSWWRRTFSTPESSRSAGHASWPAVRTGPISNITGSDYGVSRRVRRG
jgi:conjugative relaxase-like TrwC/TraI family protein